MKYVIKSLSIWILLFVVLAGCKDYRDQDLFDDKVYLINPGFKQVEVSKLESFDYKLAVYKSGMGSHDAKLQIVVDEQYLNSYNIENKKNYKLMPNNVYKIQNTECYISKKETRGIFYIKYDMVEIKKLQETNSSEYVLPIQVKVLNSIAIDLEKKNTIIYPKLNAGL